MGRPSGRLRQVVRRGGGILARVDHLREGLADSFAGLHAGGAYLDVVDGRDGEPVRAAPVMTAIFCPWGAEFDSRGPAVRKDAGRGLRGVGQGQELEEDWAAFLEVRREQELLDIGFNFGLMVLSCW